MVFCGMTTRLLAITLLALAVASCGRSDWPEPRLEFYHAATPEQAKAYAYKVAAERKLTLMNVAYTGSMRPHLTGGEMILVEPYHGQAIQTGDVLDFYREPDFPHVLHVAADQNQRAVYMSGTANKFSDGWYPKGRINGICRLVVTYPSGAKENAVYP
jgi:hypothetical protein